MNETNVDQEYYIAKINFVLCPIILIVFVILTVIITHITIMMFNIVYSKKKYILYIDIRVYIKLIVGTITALTFLTLYLDYYEFELMLSLEVVLLIIGVPAAVIAGFARCGGDNYVYYLTYYNRIDYTTWFYFISHSGSSSNTKGPYQLSKESTGFQAVFFDEEGTKIIYDWSIFKTHGIKIIGPTLEAL